MKTTLTDVEYGKNVVETEANAIKDVTTRNPKSITTGCLASEAYKILRENKIDQLPVVDSNNTPIGIIDVQDLLDTGN